MENLFDKLRADTPVNKNYKILSQQQRSDAATSNANSKSKTANEQRTEKRTATKGNATKRSAQKPKIAKTQQDKLLKNGGEIKTLIKPFRVLVKRIKWQIATADKAPNKTKNKKTLKSTELNKISTTTVLEISERSSSSNSNHVERPRMQLKKSEKPKSPALVTAAAKKSVDVPAKKRGRPKKSSTESKAKISDAVVEKQQKAHKSKQTASKTSTSKKSPIVVKLPQLTKPNRKKRKSEGHDDNVESARKVARKELPDATKNSKILLDENLVKKFGKRVFNVRVRIDKWDVKKYFKQQQSANKPKKNLSVSFVEEVEVLGSNNAQNASDERRQHSHENNDERSGTSTESHKKLVSPSPAALNKRALSKDCESDDTDDSTEAPLPLEAVEIEETLKQEVDGKAELEQQDELMPREEERLQQKDDDKLNKEEQQQQDSVRQLEENSEIEEQSREEKQSIEEEESIVEEHLEEVDEEEMVLQIEESVFAVSQQIEEQMSTKAQQPDEVENLLEEESALEEQQPQHEEMETINEEMHAVNSRISHAGKVVTANGLDLLAENEEHISDVTQETHNKLKMINDSENEMDVHFNYSPVSFESAHSEVQPPADTLSQLSDISDASLNQTQQQKMETLEEDDDDDDFVKSNVMYNANSVVEEEDMIVNAQLSVLDADPAIPVPDDVSGLLGDMDDISDKLSPMEVDHLNPTLSLMDDTNHDNAHLNLDAETLGVDGLEAHSLVDSIVHDTLDS